jgi:hypothetical protein
MNKGILLIRLTNESKQKLLNVIKPIYERVFADHVTLLYPAVWEDHLEILGQRQKIKVVGHKADSEIEAVTVEIDKRLPCQNLKAHITISSKLGVAPVRANEMLLKQDLLVNSPIDLELEGEVEFKELVG